jgi:hypothetical protein
MRSSLKLLDLVLIAALQAILLVHGAVTLPDHVRKLQVLCLQLPLEILAPVDRFLRRGSLQLDRLELLQEIQVLVPELRIQLCQCLVLAPPRVHLLLQRADLVVFASYLLAKVVLYVCQLAFQGLDPLVVLLEHQLVPLVLGTGVQVLLLEFCKPALRLPLCLLCYQGLLLPPLLLCQPPLLFLKLFLRLGLGLLLLQECLLSLGLQNTLLLLVFLVLVV